MRKQVLFENQNVRLSPSSLNLYRECPRCFYLKIKKGIHRPSGPFPSLPGGMDIVIKKYFDKFRPALPPEIAGKIQGKLFADLALLEKMRNWRTGLIYEDKKINARLSGALDDLLVQGEHYLPLDYKTRGFELKEGSHEFYQDQLNLYELLLKENGFKTKGESWLLYFHPTELSGNSLVRFEITPKKVVTSTKDGLKLFEEAVLLLQGEAPKAHSVCTFCSWGEVQHDI